MENHPLISICIPTYEAKGKGLKLLKNLLESIFSQDYTNYEIIISDHSKDSIIDQCVEDLNKISSKSIKYFKYEEHRGESAWNTNNAISHAEGSFVKLMNMDDFFFEMSSLRKMVDKLVKEETKWLLSGCVHYSYKEGIYYNPMYPRIEGTGEHLLQGLNYIGCPSVGIIPVGEYFDPNVKYMIDCELWYRMFKKYSMPTILKELLVGIGMGDHTLSSQVKNEEKELLQADINYCHEKYTAIRS